MDRLAVLARHLGGPTPPLDAASAAAPSPTAAASPASPPLAAFCPDALHRFITPDNFELRAAIKAFLKVSGVE